MAMKYNAGGTTSSIGEQLNDFYYSKYAILEAKAKNIFSNIASMVKQPKHYGETIKMYKESPIIHDANVNSQGIDADGVQMLEGKWYSWDAAGIRQEHNTKEEAKTRVGMVRIESGNGNLGGSDRDFLVQMGSIPVLSEEGGVVNGVGLKRSLVTAKIKEYGISLGFTKKELELDTETGLLTKFSKRLGEAYGMMKERQIRNGLLQAGLDNATYGGAATIMNEVNFDSQMTYGSLRLMENTLDLDLCPVDTTVLTGTTKIDTVTVPASRFMFIPYELKATIEDMVNDRGESVFTPVEKYAYDNKFIMPNEFGKIGRFRFVLVHDMPYFVGEGAAVDAADPYALYSTNGNYDVFPALVVGDDSFATMGLAGESATVNTVLPKADAYNDRFGKKGSASISWYFGLIIKRPERIKVGLFTAKTM